MAGLIPEGAVVLQATAFVSQEELAAVGKAAIIRESAERMAERAFRKLLDNCIKTESDYAGYQGQTLRLEVYVLAPSELHKMLADARMQGERDAMRWGKSCPTKADGA